MEILIGDRVRWAGLNGWRYGEVVCITPYSQGKVYDIETFTGRKLDVISVHEDDFAMADLKVIFRDVQIQIERGERII